MNVKQAWYYLSMATKLLWVDLETTGLDDKLDPILEVGLIVTRYEAPWVELESYSAVCRPVEEWETRMDDYVKSMHSGNGLLDEVKTCSRTLEDVEGEVIGLLARHGKKGQFLLAGSGVGHFDRRMISSQMKTLDSWLKYNNFDVGSLRLLLQVANRRDLVRTGLSWGEGVEKPHRGLADIRDHLAECSAYVDMVRSVTV